MMSRWSATSAISCPAKAKALDTTRGFLLIASTSELTLDTIAQVVAKVKECEGKLGLKVKPIVFGSFTSVGSTQSIAALNNVHLVNLPSKVSGDRLNRLLDEELEKVITGVS